jgi:hypothetical protein
MTQITGAYGGGCLYVERNKIATFDVSQRQNAYQVLPYLGKPTNNDLRISQI